MKILRRLFHGNLYSEISKQHEKMLSGIEHDPPLPAERIAQICTTWAKAASYVGDPMEREALAEYLYFWKTQLLGTGIEIEYNLYPFIYRSPYWPRLRWAACISLMIVLAGIFGYVYGWIGRFFFG